MLFDFTIIGNQIKGKSRLGVVVHKVCEHVTQKTEFSGPTTLKCNDS